MSLYPTIAASASLIDHFRMPMREIEVKFTLSEIVITAWRSREIVSKFGTSGHSASQGEVVEPPGNFVNEQGELDLSTATGPEAVSAFARIGLFFPVIHK